jgi:hypothetical protein
MVVSVRAGDRARVCCRGADVSLVAVPAMGTVYIAADPAARSLVRVLRRD